MSLRRFCLLLLVLCCWTSHRSPPHLNSVSPLKHNRIQSSEGDLPEHKQCHTCATMPSSHRHLFIKFNKSFIEWLPIITKQILGWLLLIWLNVSFINSGTDLGWVNWSTYYVVYPVPVPTLYQISITTSTEDWRFKRKTFDFLHTITKVRVSTKRSDTKEEESSHFNFKIQAVNDNN